MEHERRRKEQEEDENKEAERKQLEEEEAKAQRLTELKSKAESLRQEKRTLFGMLKQALTEEAKKKQREERAERLRQEEQEKKEKKERALAEAAQALAGGNVHGTNHPGMNPMMTGKMGQMGGMAQGMGNMGGVGGVPGMPLAYGHQPHGGPFLSPRQGFYGGQDSPRGLPPPQGSGAAGSAGRMHNFPPAQPGQGAAGYGSPPVGVGGVGRSMLGSLQGQNQRFMNMQAYQNQTAMLSRMTGGAMGPGRGSDNRPPPPSAPPPMDSRDPAATQQQMLQGQPGGQAGGRGRGMLYPPGGRGFGYRRC